MTGLGSDYSQIKREIMMGRDALTISRMIRVRNIKWAINKIEDFVTVKYE